MAESVRSDNRSIAPGAHTNQPGAHAPGYTLSPLRGSGCASRGDLGSTPVQDSDSRTSCRPKFSPRKSEHAWIPGLTFLLLFGLALAPGARAEEAAEEKTEPTTLGQALKQGELHLAFRYRIETVSEDGFDKDAYASTLRTTLGYGSKVYKGFSFHLEAENVSALGDEDYRNLGAGSLDNGVRDRPVVADPEITELTKALIRWQGDETLIDVGRREIIFDNHRFVGNVGWRQHHQSFDTILLEQGSIPRTKLTYAYIDQVNRIFGDGRPMSSHLLNAAITTSEHTKLTLYGYRLDYDELSFSSLSTTTVGARFTGGFTPGWGKVGFELEIADQSDTGDNPFEVDASYQLASVTLGRGGWSVQLAHEVLEGSQGKGRFTTPLATLHKFNGWADKFLNTPSIGLVDTWVTLGYKQGPWTTLATYHVFTSDSQSVDYGDELDFLLTWKSPWQQTFGLKAASYQADRFSRDTDKIMAWTAWGF